MKRSSASTSIEPLEQRLRLVRGERAAEGAGLDLLAQPLALTVRRDVLDLVRDRAAVGLAQVRQLLDERRALHVRAEQARGNARHQLGRETDVLGIERRVARGL